MPSAPNLENFNGLINDSQSSNRISSAGQVKQALLDIIEEYFTNKLLSFHPYILSILNPKDCSISFEAFTEIPGIRKITQDFNVLINALEASSYVIFDKKARIILFKHISHSSLIIKDLPIKTTLQDIIEQFKNVEPKPMYIEPINLCWYLFFEDRMSAQRCLLYLQTHNPAFINSAYIRPKFKDVPVPFKDYFNPPLINGHTDLNELTWEIYEKDKKEPQILPHETSVSNNLVVVVSSLENVPSITNLQNDVKHQYSILNLQMNDPISNSHLTSVVNTINSFNTNPNNNNLVSPLSFTSNSGALKQTTTYIVSAGKQNMVSLTYKSPQMVVNSSASPFPFHLTSNVAAAASIPKSIPNNNYGMASTIAQHNNQQLSGIILPSFPPFLPPSAATPKPGTHQMPPPPIYGLIPFNHLQPQQQQVVHAPPGGPHGTNPLQQHHQTQTHQPLLATWNGSPYNSNNSPATILPTNTRLYPQFAGAFPQAFHFYGGNLMTANPLPSGVGGGASSIVSSLSMLNISNNNNQHHNTSVAISNPNNNNNLLTHHFPPSYNSYHHHTPPQPPNNNNIPAGAKFLPPPQFPINQTTPFLPLLPQQQQLLHHHFSNTPQQQAAPHASVNHHPAVINNSANHSSNYPHTYQHPHHQTTHHVQQQGVESTPPSYPSSKHIQHQTYTLPPHGTNNNYNNSHHNNNTYKKHAPYSNMYNRQSQQHQQTYYHQQNSNTVNNYYGGSLNSGAPLFTSHTTPTAIPPPFAKGIAALNVLPPSLPPTGSSTFKPPPALHRVSPQNSSVINVNKPGHYATPNIVVTQISPPYMYGSVTAVATSFQNTLPISTNTSSTTAAYKTTHYHHHGPPVRRQHLNGGGVPSSNHHGGINVTNFMMVSSSASQSSFSPKHHNNNNNNNYLDKNLNNHNHYTITSSSSQEPLKKTTFTHNKAFRVDIQSQEDDGHNRLDENSLPPSTSTSNYNNILLTNSPKNKTLLPLDDNVEPAVLSTYKSLSETTGGSSLSLLSSSFNEGSKNNNNNQQLKSADESSQQHHQLESSSTMKTQSKYTANSSKNSCNNDILLSPSSTTNTFNKLNETPNNGLAPPNVGTKNNFVQDTMMTNPPTTTNYIGLLPTTTSTIIGSSEELDEEEEDQDIGAGKLSYAQALKRKNRHKLKQQQKLQKELKDWSGGETSLEPKILTTKESSSKFKGKNDENKSFLDDLDSNWDSLSHPVSNTVAAVTSNFKPKHKTSFVGKPEGSNSNISSLPSTNYVRDESYNSSSKYTTGSGGRAASGKLYQDTWDIKEESINHHPKVVKKDFVMNNNDSNQTSSNKVSSFGGGNQQNSTNSTSSNTKISRTFSNSKYGAAPNTSSTSYNPTPTNSRSPVMTSLSKSFLPISPTSGSHNKSMRNTDGGSSYNNNNFSNYNYRSAASHYGSGSGSTRLEDLPYHPKNKAATLARLEDEARKKAAANINNVTAAPCPPSSSPDLISSSTTTPIITFDMSSKTNTEDFPLISTRTVVVTCTNAPININTNKDSVSDLQQKLPPTHSNSATKYKTSIQHHENKSIPPNTTSSTYTNYPSRADYFKRPARSTFKRVPPNNISPSNTTAHGNSLNNVKVNQLSDRNGGTTANKIYSGGHTNNNNLGRTYSLKNSQRKEYSNSSSSLHSQKSSGQSRNSNTNLNTITTSTCISSGKLTLDESNTLVTNGNKVIKALQ